MSNSEKRPGFKDDKEKVRPDLILDGMSRAIMSVAEVGTFGAKKYTEDGWAHVADGVKRYKAAMDRHRLLSATEDNDPESGILHAAHLAWNALAVLELMLRDKENKGA